MSAAVEYFDDDEPCAPAPTRLLGSPDIVAHWPCRATGCKSRVSVTAAAREAFALWNDQLAKRGEEPLREGEVVFCDSCAVVVEQKRREAVERTRKQIEIHIAELRDPNTPPHIVAVAEHYIAKRANEGDALVKMLAKQRAEAERADQQPRRGGRNNGW